MRNYGFPLWRRRNYIFHFCFVSWKILNTKSRVVLGIKSGLCVAVCSVGFQALLNVYSIVFLENCIIFKTYNKVLTLKIALSSNGPKNQRSCLSLLQNARSIHINDACSQTDEHCLPWASKCCGSCDCKTWENTFRIQRGDKWINKT